MQADFLLRERTGEVVFKDKTDLYIDVGELITGLLLVAFLWTHMVFVGTIFVSTGIFNTLASWLELTRMAQVARGAVPALIGAHIIFAMMKIPVRFQEQRVAWNMARRMNSFEIWSWIFQIVSGAGILTLASIHIWSVTTDFPIYAAKSAGRVSDKFFFFYIILLTLGELHATVGLGRQLIKWGWWDRHKANIAIKIVTACMIALGLGALIIFKRMGATI